MFSVISCDISKPAAYSDIMGSKAYWPVRGFRCLSHTWVTLGSLSPYGPLQLYFVFALFKAFNIPGMQILFECVTLTRIIKQMCRIWPLSSVLNSENVNLYCFYRGFVSFPELLNIPELQEKPSIKIRQNFPYNFINFVKFFDQHFLYDMV
jgi:hypothetical protein